MFEYIKGKISSLSPTLAVVDTGGLGFALNISLETYSALEGRDEACLYVYEAVREDAFTLYGFATLNERRMFLLLIGVSGVGAGTARVILSSLSVSELCQVIASGDERQLKGVKGIGLKTAQRIIVDLKDKVDDLLMEEGSSLVKTPSNQHLAEAEAALTMLGFAPAAVRKVLSLLLEKDSTLTVEQLIKAALKQL